MMPIMMHRVSLGLLFCLLQVMPMLGEPIHVVILGDSNTWIGGDECSKPEGWNTWFKQAFEPTSCRSYARSGATWTNTSETKQNTQENIGKLGNDNVIYNQICRLKDACNDGSQPIPDLIIIAAGTNDAWFASKRPKAFAMSVREAFAQQEQLTISRPVNEVLTLAESVRYGCELLMEAFPNAQLILLTPLQSTSALPELIEKTGDIIEQCGHRMAISVIRMDHEGCVYATRERVSKKYTRDGTHTNEAGARRNGILLAKRVKQLLVVK